MQKPKSQTQKNKGKQNLHLQKKFFKFSSGLLISAIVINTLNFAAVVNIAHAGPPAPKFCAFTDVQGGDYNSLALKSDGTVWAWGANSVGQLGDGTTTDKLTPVQVIDPDDGTGFLTGITKITENGDHALALKNDGTVWAWGLNANGQLGDGTTTDSHVPVQVSGLTGITEISNGRFHSMALKNDGTVWTWGLNANGQLGDNTVTERHTPVQVSGITTATAINGGRLSSYALLSDETVKSWGINTHKELGDGTTTERHTPVSVISVSGVSAIAGGRQHAMALKTDGTVWAWGTNVEGELGIGTNSTNSNPVQVTDPLDGSGFLTGVTNISAGRFHSLVLKTDGTAWGWGGDDFGQITGGIGAPENVPTQISDSTTVDEQFHDGIAISAGNTHSLAIKSDGTLWSWGENSSGELGDGTTTDQGVANPVAITQNCITPNSGTTLGGTNVTISGSNFAGVTSVTFGGNAATNVTTVSSTTITATTPAHEAGQVSVVITNSDAQTATLTNGFTYINPPAPRFCGTNEVAGGGEHELALENNGLIKAWGLNSQGQLGDGTTTSSSSPVDVSGLTNVSAVAGGGFHSLAVKSDGTVWAWGSNSDGQLGDGTTNNSSTPVQVSGLTDVNPNQKTIAGGFQNSFAVKTDGTVWGWGTNFAGELGDGTTISRHTPVQVTDPTDGSGFLTNITQVVAGSGTDAFTVALKNDGTVWAWGYNGHGELGDNTTTNRHTPVQVSGLTNVTAIAARGSFTLALKSDGTIWAWGLNSNGQLGDNTTTNRHVPVQVSGISNATAIAAGYNFSLAQDNEGDAFAWGDNSSGEIGDGTFTQRNTPVQVTDPADGGFLSNVQKISAGGGTGIAIETDNTVKTWGFGFDGELGNGATNSENVPQIVINLDQGCISPNSGPTSGNTAVTISGANFLNGATVTFGGNNASNVVVVDSETITATTPAHALGAVTVVIRNPDAHTATLPNGFTYVSGPGVPDAINDLDVEAGDGEATLTWSPPNDNGATITNYLVHWGPSGGAHPCNPTLSYDFNCFSAGAITSPHLVTGLTNGTDYIFAVFSENSVGRSPPSNLVNATPQAGTTGCEFIQEAAGQQFSLGLAGDGTVWGWGRDDVGELGDGIGGNKDLPVQTIGLTGITEISAGSNHSLAVKDDGTVWAWGGNLNGQLGDGTTTNHSTPIQVSGLTGMTAVAAGNGFSLALKNDGTVWAWGINNYGQLGNGTNTESHTPVQVSSLTNITAIAAGIGHGLGLKNDGTVWAWGDNQNGQLGDGTTTDQTSPVQTTGLSGITAIAAGQGYSSMALKSNGTVWDWGENQSGQLGDGTTTDRTSPVQATGLSGITAIAAGGGHGLAIKNDGTVWTWGFNLYGGLGDGTNTNHSTPAQISGITGAIGIAGGDYHSLAIKNDGTSIAWGFNFSGQLGNGNTTDSNVPVQTSMHICNLSIDPNHGPTTGNTSVTINGQNFQNGATVTFGSETPVSTTFVNSTTLTLSTPAHTPAETVDVTVTNPDDGFATMTNGFTYDSASSSCDFTANSLAAGDTHSLGLKADGTVWLWGNQHGIGTNEPSQVAGLSNISAVSTTGGGNIIDTNGYSLALKNDGTVWAWGVNTDGRFGDGTTNDSDTPVQVTDPSDGSGFLQNVAGISAGFHHAVILKNDGTVWAWGRGTSGQLGNGTASDSLVPVQVSGLTNILQVSAGGDFSLALKNDGTVWAWGSNSNGKLGDGTTNDSATPVQVTDPSDGSGFLQSVSLVSAGLNHAAALKGDTTVWTWGLNQIYGELGDGTTTNSSVPVQVTDPSDGSGFLQNVAQISVGGNHTLVIKNDGTVWGWGRDAEGELGDGTLTNTFVPVQVSGLTNVTTLATGGQYSLARELDGTIWGFGENSSGQTGAPPLTNTASPVKIVTTDCNISSDPPDPITDLTANPGDGLASLHWTAPNDNGSAITNYHIIYGEETGGNACDPTTSPYTNCLTQDTLSTSPNISGLTNDTSYIFDVYAENANGSSDPSNTAITTPSASANCPSLGPDESCAVSRITGGDLTFTDIPDNTSFTNAQNNTNLPSYNNDGGTDNHDIMSVTDLRDDAGAGFEVQLSSTPFAADNNTDFIPLQYLYVVTSLPRILGAIDDESNGVEYASGCVGSTNNITGSVNAPEPLALNALGTFSTFTNSGSDLGTGNTTTPVVLMSSPATARRCTVSQAVSYAVNLPGYITALGTNIPAGTYTTTFTYTLIAT